LLRKFWDFYSKSQRDAPMSQIYFILEWHSTCFGRSFHSSSGIQACIYSNRHLSNRYCCLLASKQTAVPVWQMPVAVYTGLNSWWWMERPSETCRVSFQDEINLRHWWISLVFTIEIYNGVRPNERQILRFRCAIWWAPNYTIWISL